jgi:hypothetical protein
MGVKRQGRLAVILVGVLTLTLSANARSVMAIEKARYRVEERDGRFELRQYEPHIVAETLVRGSFGNAGNTGFSRLFRYIQGNNRKRESISMTAPVSQEQGSEKISMTAPVGQEKRDEEWSITFLMPSAYTMETLPEPLDRRVKLRRVEGRLIASFRYSGNWSEKRFEKKRALLLAHIARRGLRPAGETIFARYNPPFLPPFLRRNEVLIPVKRGG